MLLVAHVFLWDHFLRCWCLLCLWRTRKSASTSSRTPLTSCKVGLDPLCFELLLSDPALRFRGLLCGCISSHSLGLIFCRVSRAADSCACTERAPDGNFNQLPLALLSLWQLFTGQNWDDLLYAGVRARGCPSGQRCVSCCVAIAVALLRCAGAWFRPASHIRHVPSCSRCAGINATSWSAAWYFMSFVVINTILFSNLFKALFLESRRGVEQNFE